MQRRSIIPFILAATGVLPGFWPTGAAAGQPIMVAPGLSVPMVPSADLSSVFLTTARKAVVLGHTGEAREALERAETRLLDRALPSPAAASLPDTQRAGLAIGTARRALAAHDRPAAIAAIDGALASAGRPQFAVAAAPLMNIAPAADRAPPLPQQQPVITRALLPGHWALQGARYVWIPPETKLRRVQSAGLVPGANVWHSGAYVWVPAHYEN